MLFLLDEAVQYRIILGAGAVPPIVLLLRTSRRHWMTKDAVSLDMKMSSFWPFQATDKSFTPDGNGILALPKAYWALACDSSINKQLAGTALCWFFFDVYVYGVSTISIVSNVPVYRNQIRILLVLLLIFSCLYHHFALHLRIISRSACTRQKFSRTSLATAKRSLKITGKTCSQS
jgi:hypothetical protein